MAHSVRKQRLQSTNPRSAPCFHGNLTIMVGYVKFFETPKFRGQYAKNQYPGDRFVGTTK